MHLLITMAPAAALLAARLSRRRWPVALPAWSCAAAGCVATSAAWWASAAWVTTTGWPLVALTGCTMAAAHAALTSTWPWSEDYVTIRARDAAVSRAASHRRRRRHIDRMAHSGPRRA